MIVLDASVIIAYLDMDDTQHLRAEELLAREVHDDFAASPLTLAEVLVAPARDGRMEQVRAVLRDLEVQELPFPADASVKLAFLRASTGLKMPDCCVLLAVQVSGARVASFDDRLNRVAAARNLPTAQP